MLMTAQTIMMPLPNDADGRGDDECVPIGEGCDCSVDGDVLGISGGAVDDRGGTEEYRCYKKNVK